MAAGGRLNEDFAVLRPQALFSSAGFNPPHTLIGPSSSVAMDKHNNSF